MMYVRKFMKRCCQWDYFDFITKYSIKWIIGAEHALWKITFLARSFKNMKLDIRSRLCHLLLTFQNRQAYVNIIYNFFSLKLFQMLNKKSCTSKVQNKFLIALVTILYSKKYVKIYEVKDLSLCIWKH